MPLRTYKECTPQHEFYRELHEKQTLEYVDLMLRKYKTLDKCKMSMKRALSLMDEFIDPSDPDMDLPNSIHAYQTAERIRKDYPNDEEFQLCGLIHDLGKVLFKFGEPSYGVVGDTFVVGCAYPFTIVYYDSLKNNPDYDKYNTLYGIYEPKCGIENLKISYCHDEYLYNVLKNNKNHKMHSRYMKMIRFHSFYPWHTGGSYGHFMKEDDKDLLSDVLLLNNYDLYSKEDVNFELTDEIKIYYDNLLDKYFPGEMMW